MRYPDTPFMRRTFDLIKNRGLNVKLIPYIMDDSPNTFLFYNNVRVNDDGDIRGDPFGVQNYVVDQNLKTPEGVAKKVAEVLRPFRDLFVPTTGSAQTLPTPDIGPAMAKLFEKTNIYSTRSYMLTEKRMDPKDVHWCETLDKSTGWYDLALTESK